MRGPAVGAGEESGDLMRPALMWTRERARLYLRKTGPPEAPWKVILLTTDFLPFSALYRTWDDARDSIRVYFESGFILVYPGVTGRA